MGQVASKSAAAALEFGSDGFDREIYEGVANKARLLEVCLAKQSYEVKMLSYWKAESEGNLDYSFSGEPISNPSIDVHQGYMVGGYKWSASLRNGRRKVLKLSAEYMLMYENMIDVDVEYAALYFSKIARFTSYPYFRSVFAITTANSGISLAPLPSLVDRVD